MTARPSSRFRGLGRRLLAFMAALLLMLALSSQGGAFQAGALTKAQLNQKKAALEKEAAELDKQLKNASNTLEGQKKELADMQKKVENSQQQLDILNEQMEAINTALSGKNTEIADKEKEIAAKETTARTMAVQLEERIRAVAKRGNLSTVQMLLSAEDYAEYLIKSKMLEKIAENDEKAMNALEAELAQIKTDKAALEADRQGISGEKSQVEALQKEANAKKKEMENLYKAIQSKVSTLSGQVSSIKQERADIDKEMKEVDQELTRLIQNTASTGKYGDGTMVWPVPTVRNISSPFGQRWGKLHKGIDICNGTIPIYGEKIYAAADGVVIYANYTNTWGGGYGYFTMVDHGVDSQGRKITTLYAHTLKLYARVGDKVKAGQTVLGLVGTTGDVTGPHLHFEVRVNGTPVDPLKGYLSIKG